MIAGCKSSFCGGTVCSKSNVKRVVGTCNGTWQGTSIKFTQKGRGRRSAIIYANLVVATFSLKSKKYQSYVCVRSTSVVSVVVAVVFVVPTVFIITPWLAANLKTLVYLAPDTSKL